MTNLVAAVVLLASWEQFDDSGKIAANGKAFNPAAMTCATRLWPLGTILKVRDTHNGFTVTVRVTDRPARRFGHSRIDLSPAAFQVLAGLDKGLDEVEVSSLPNAIKTR